MKTQRKTKPLSKAEIKRLVGAKVSVSVGKLPSDPVGMKAIAPIVRGRLVSRGGRPSDPKWTIVRKVPMKPETWNKLDQFAQELQQEEIKISAGQVAAIALEQGLSITSGVSVQFAAVSTSAPKTQYQLSTEVRMKARRSHLAVVHNNGSVW
jgi:hypothetical protein